MGELGRAAPVGAVHSQSQQHSTRCAQPRPGRHVADTGASVSCGAALFGCASPRGAGWERGSRPQRAARRRAFVAPSTRTVARTAAGGRRRLCGQAGSERVSGRRRRVRSAPRRWGVVCSRTLGSAALQGRPATCRPRPEVLRERQVGAEVARRAPGGCRSCEEPGRRLGDVIAVCFLGAFNSLTSRAASLYTATPSI